MALESFLVVLVAVLLLYTLYELLFGLIQAWEMWLGFLEDRKALRFNERK